MLRGPAMFIVSQAEYDEGRVVWTITAYGSGFSLEQF